MSTLIKDVLAYSRVSTHREPFESVSLDQVLADVCHELQADFRETGVRFDAGVLPTVQGDCAQLRYLFGHLIANALKFQADDQPAVIQVTCRTEPGADGPSGLNSTAFYHEISLSDNGIGFDMKYANQIFGVFQRLHTRQKYAGTGVGLAICKRVTKNHRGTIIATS